MTIAIDVAIGLMLVYLLLSLLVTTLQELELGGGKPSRFCSGLPSYIPSQTFVIALLDVLRGTKAASDAVGAGELLASARKSLEGVTEPELKRVLTLLVGDAEQLAAGMNERSRLVSERLETWFNDRMSRASGWYKRRAHSWSLGLGLVLSVAFNADTFRLAQQLWSDGALRSGVVAAAQAVGEGGAPAAGLQASVLPLGWQHAPTLAQLPLEVLGWLVTALAVSLGATFWFELLTKTLRFRNTGLRVSPATGKVTGAPVEVLP